MTFGDKLKKQRLKKGLTQSDLAKITKIRTDNIEKYESGKTYPNKRGIYDVLAKTLDVDVNYFKGQQEEFYIKAYERYGYSGLNQAIDLLREPMHIINGESLDEHDKEIIKIQLQKAFWIAKEQKKKYSSKTKK